MIEAAFASIGLVIAAHAARPRPTGRSLAEPARRHNTALRRARWRPRRTPELRPGDVAVWCESLARVVRGGSTLTTAVRTVDVAPALVPAVGQIVLQLDRGRRLVEAVSTSSPSPHLNLALTVLRACATNGGPPAEPLDRAASTLRGRAADLAERRVQSSQARLSSIVMTVLPLGMLAMLLLTSATTRAAAATPTGMAAIAGGGTLNLLGWRWMRRIIDGGTS